MAALQIAMEERTVMLGDSRGRRDDSGGAINVASGSTDVSDSGTVSIQSAQGVESSGFIPVNTGDVSRGINGISGD